VGCRWSPVTLRTTQIVYLWSSTRISATVGDSSHRLKTHFSERAVLRLVLSLFHFLTQIAALYWSTTTMSHFQLSPKCII